MDDLDTIQPDSELIEPTSYELSIAGWRKEILSAVIEISGDDSIVLAS